MYSNNETVRSAARLMVAVALMIVAAAGSARADNDDLGIDFDALNSTIALEDSWRRGFDLAQDRSGRPDRRDDVRGGDDGGSNQDERELEPWESGSGDEDEFAFDNRRIEKDKTTKFGFIYGEINLGGGMVRSLNAGPEISIFSAFAYANGSLRFAQFGLSNSVIMQVGLSLNVEKAWFDSRQYEGTQIRTSAGPEFAFLFLGSKRPVGMAVIRLRLGFMHEEGNSLISSYKLGFQDNTLADIDGFVETYALEQETGKRTYAWGGRQVIRHAWLHATQLRYRVIYQLHSERHEPGFAEGRNSNNSRLELGLTQWIYRGGWNQGEWAVGGLFEVNFSYAAGYRTLSHDTIVTQLRAGITTRLQLLQHGYLYVTPTVGYNARVRDGHGPDNLDWGVTATLSFNCW